MLKQLKGVMDTIKRSAANQIELLEVKNVVIKIYKFNIMFNVY